MKDKEDILAKWLNGELPDNELKALEGPNALEELDRVISEVDQWSMPDYITTTGSKKMKERLKAEAVKDLRSKRLRVMAIASVFALLLYALLVYFGNKGQELKAVNGQNLHFAFEDGSEVWLNDGSSMQSNTKEWAAERIIELEGEALFQVSKGVPFIVNTPNGNITVLGTQFNVRAWGNNLYVECYEGSVQVRSDNQQTILTAQESVNVVEGSMNDKQVISSSSPAWQNGISRFYDEKLKIVCNELERQYDINVELRATDRLFSGNFGHDDLEVAIEAICKPLGLKAEFSSDRKTIIIE